MELPPWRGNRGGKKMVKCAYCGRRFEKYLSRIVEGQRCYCNREHQRLFQISKRPAKPKKYHWELKDKMRAADRMYSLRRATGLSQKDYAKMLGVSLWLVIKIENCELEEVQEKWLKALRELKIPLRRCL